MSLKKKKIFLGFVEIASQIEIYKKAFESLGYEVFSVLNRHATLTTTNRGNYSFVIKNLLSDVVSVEKESYKDMLWQTYHEFIRKILFRKALKECDIFFFTYNSSFFPDRQDFAYLKKIGKKIIVNFCGTDIRWKPAMAQEFSKYSMYPVIYGDIYNRDVTLMRQIDALRMAEKYADVILSLPNQSQLALRPYNNFFYPVCLDEIKENSVQSKKKPFVAHAPSMRSFKGTEYILEAFDRLKAEGVSFETVLIENMPYDKALKAYENIDVLVGQVNCPGGGKQAFELLAGGKVVLSCMGYDAGYPQFEKKEDCPIVDVNRDNVYQILKRIIEDYSLRQSLANKGRPYVEKHHNVYKLCEKIIDCFDDDTRIYHHYPSFFREEFIPEAENMTWVYNKYNQMVKDCDWYKEHVKPGKRDGLIF